MKLLLFDVGFLSFEGYFFFLSRKSPGLMEIQGKPIIQQDCFVELPPQFAWVQIMNISRRDTCRQTAGTKGDRESTSTQWPLCKSEILKVSGGDF